MRGKVSSQNTNQMSRDDMMQTSSIPESPQAMSPEATSTAGVAAKVRPLVSVIVPVRNEEAHIARTLEQLLDQRHDGFDVEILVADGRSTDRTREIVEELAKRHRRIRLIDNPGRLSSAARNLGIGESRGDYVVIIDGHCEIRSRSYFADLVAAFERTGADCLGRPQPLDISGASPLQQAIAAARNSPLGHHPASFIYSDREIEVPAISVAVAYRREVFDRVGPFDPAFDACEDCELNHRIDQAGLACWLVPELAVHYKPRNTISGLFRQMVRYGRGRVRMARKHRGSLSISTVLPALFLVGLIAGPLVCWWLPPLWFFYGAVLLLYGLSVGYFSFRSAAVAGNFGLLFPLPLVFATIHLGSAWGVWREVFSRRAC